MLYLKALHIVFVVSWFAGLLYLPRLFVYHTEVTDEAGHLRFCVMERRLYRMTTIGLIGTWTFGVWMLLKAPAFLQMGWLHAKFVLVVLLTAYHGWLKTTLQRFAARANTHSGRYYRIANEVPTLFLLAIVVLVVLKPL